MSRQRMLQECDQRLHGLLAELSRPVQTAVAALVVGVVHAGSAVLSAAGPAMPGPAADPSKQVRAQRLLANERLVVARAQRRLLVRVLRSRRGRLDLLLDATTTGATARHPGTLTLCLAVGWHGRALPLLWRTWPAEAKGQNWQAAIRQMLETVQEHLPTAVQVVLLADRGLSGAPLARAAVAVGWHYLLRVQRQTRLQLADGSVVPIGAVLPAPGPHRCLDRVRVWAPRRKRKSGWVALWDEALVANVVAVWRAGEADPWLLVTDLPATLERCAEYRRRTWQEELFRDLKGFGWQWQRSRVRTPARVERLLLVLALATLWMLALGQRVVRRGWRRLLDARRRRSYSYFQLGRRWFQRALATDQPVPVLFHFWSESFAPPKLL